MSSTITFKGMKPIECISVTSDTALVTSAEDLLKQLYRPKIDILFDAKTDAATLLQIYSTPEALEEISIDTKIPYERDIMRPATEEELIAMEEANKVEDDGDEAEVEDDDNSPINPSDEDDETADDNVEEDDEPIMVPDTITDYKTESFIHLNYNIRLGLAFKNVDGKEVWVMSLAQLTETDIQLRAIAGYIAKKTNFLTFEEYQKALIEQSKEDLSTYLEGHPLISNCYHNQYNKFNATEQHRNLFTTKYFAHMCKTQAGLPDQFTWNISGQECTPWTDEEALYFVIAMDAYVTPLVHAQQVYELAIKAAKTKEELDAIVIDYSTVTTVNGDESLIGT